MYENEIYQGDHKTEITARALTLTIRPALWRIFPKAAERQRVQRKKEKRKRSRDKKSMFSASWPSAPDWDSASACSVDLASTE